MTETGQRFMEFKLGSVLFAIALESVREVLQKPEVTQIPNMPSHFEGMINLRGQILGLFSARKKLLPSTDKSAVASHPVVIVIEENGSQMGIVVDEVTRVISPTQEQISAPPLKANDPASQFVKAVIKIDQSLVVVVKLSEVLGIEQIKKSIAA